MTIAMPACVMRVVTSLVEPSTAVTSAPDDEVSNFSTIARGKMRCDCPVCSTTRSRLPRGRQLVTLRDAALYITKLPKAEQQLEEWQTAVENLINAAEVAGGWLMLARVGVMRALNRHVERVFNPIAKSIIGNGGS
jgi:hypothetical protein